MERITYTDTFIRDPKYWTILDIIDVLNIFLIFTKKKKIIIRTNTSTRRMVFALLRGETRIIELVYARTNTLEHTRVCTQP